MSEAQVAQHLVLALGSANLLLLDIAGAIIILVEALKEELVVVQSLQVRVPLGWRQILGHVQVRTGAIGELPVWLAHWRLIGLGQVEEVGLRVEQYALLVLMVDSVGGIVLGEGRYAGPDVLDSNGLVGPQKRVDDSPLVAVSVSVELGDDGVLEAVDNVDKVEEPGLSAFAVVGRHVANDMHLILVEFRLE